MMLKFSQVLALSGLAVVASATIAIGAAPSRPKPGVIVRFSGCTEPGVEAQCLMVKSGQATYNITGATPKPDVGRYIEGRGTVSNGPDTCMQGVKLTQVSWKYSAKMIACKRLPLTK